MAGLLSGEESDCPCAGDGRRTSLVWTGKLVRRAIRGASAPLAHPAAVERDDPAPRRYVGALPRRSLGAIPRRSVRGFLGSFSAIPNSRSRRSISIHTSLGWMPEATQSTTRL